MSCKLVVDSCCDVMPMLREKISLTMVPLIMKLGDATFVDDEKINITEFLAKMKSTKTTARSSCPSPGDYAAACAGADTAFVVTLSSNLSGSYNSAVACKELMDGQGPEIHVIDSKSASAGELLVALKLAEAVENKVKNSDIVKNIETFVKDMKTFFVLESLDNLIKNGRMSKIAGTVASVLGMRPILGSDGNGNITFYAKARGMEAAIKKLADTIGEHCKDTTEKTLVITHCNNEKQANRLCDMVKAAYSFKEILITPTGGLSSMYANDGGIVIAF